MSLPLWDPGVQHERTSLAWSRTALAYAASALLCARLAEGHPTLAASLAVLGLATTTLLLGRSGARYRRTAEALHAGRPVAQPWRLLAVAALTIVLGMVALVLIWALALPR